MLFFNAENVSECTFVGENSLFFVQSKNCLLFIHLKKSTHEGYNSNTPLIFIFFDCGRHLFFYGVQARKALLMFTT